MCGVMRFISSSLLFALASSLAIILKSLNYTFFCMYFVVVWFLDLIP